MARKKVKKLRNINPKEILSTIWIYIKTLYRMFERDYLFLLSSGIAFYIVLCFIPFVLILFTVVGIDSFYAAPAFLSSAKEVYLC